ncbi:MAG: peptidase M23 [Flavobacteriales bacterium]|nr:peptidase M23 [Flavobacteriales bacterium]|tara:strand:- start:2074 stop:2919 length:846 start_codon:yes stop_codon:yes gene_type:complete
MKGMFLVSLLLVCNIVFSFSPDSAIVSVEKIEPKPAMVVWDINDSLYHIPSFDLYCGFDQTKIWGMKVDQTKKKDTTTIKLLHDSCDFHSPWIGRLTSEYGWRNNRPHYGIDLKLSTGDSVQSVFDGMIRISRYSASYGHVVVIRHLNGLETLYAHLSKRLVKEGDEIHTGEVLGLGGNTGRSFGSHLHFETRYLGEPINPRSIFEINDSSFTIKEELLMLNASHFTFLKEVRRIKYHRVRSGDSLWRISKKYGVSISKLCRLNGISRKKTLRIGERLRYN